MIAATIFLALILALGYVAHREHLARTAAEDDAATLAVSNREHLETIADLEGRLRDAQHAADLARIDHLRARTAQTQAEVEAWQMEMERDRYRTAFTAKLLLEARESEIAPDEARGVAEVVELPVKKGRRA